MRIISQNKTIVAVATGNGGAISVIRVSGERAIEIVNTIFISKSGKKLADSKGFTLHYGDIFTETKEVLDDVIISLFRAPRSYTGEDMVEISVHSSEYIISTLISLLISNGGSMAEPGEYTMRAFTNGKMDLVQAEAVADLIAASSASSHRLASNQMRGGYSAEFGVLRSELIETMSLIELELDFGEEDVEFADRSHLLELLVKIRNKAAKLSNSFARGNAIKNGVPVAIVGSPNAGKSTLLNAILGDERAIVSDIEGTTRDVIEERKVIGGVSFRFIDTAGLRETTDYIEKIGIERTRKVIDGADFILLLLDGSQPREAMLAQINDVEIMEHQQLILVFNKMDKGDFSAVIRSVSKGYKFTTISALNGNGVEELEDMLSSEYSLAAAESKESVIITNLRHFEILRSCDETLKRAISGVETGISGDFIAQDLRECSYLLGTLSGEISSDEILGSIFSKHCIGK